MRFEAPDGANEALTIVPDSAMLNTPWSMADCIWSSVSEASSNASRASSTLTLPLATFLRSVVIVSSIIDHLFA